MSLYTRGRTRRSLIDTVAFRAVSQLATILGYIVMVRGMSKQDFGTFNLLYAFIPVVSTVASLGLEQTLRRYQPEYLSADNQAAASWLVGFVASTRFVSNIILLGAILLGWNYVAPLFKLGSYRVEFAVFCLLVLLFFQARILQIALAGRMLHRYSVGSMAVLAIVKLVAYGALVWRDALTVQSAIIADTIAFGIAYLSMLGAYRRHCLAGSRARYRPEATERRRLLRYGMFNNFNDAGTLMLTSKTDNFFIAAIIDAVSVGIYGFYTRLNEMASHLLPGRMFENVIQPMVFAIPAGEADRRMPQVFSLLLNINLMLQWPILAFSTAYHKELVEVLFGGKYVEHSWMLPLIAAFSTLNLVGTPVTLVAQYEEKAATILASKIFGVYNALALLVLLPIAGVYGAAVASGTAQVMKNGFIWWRVRKRARWTNALRALAAGTVLWGTTVFVCRALATTMTATPLLSIVVGALITGMAFLAHVRGPAFSADDRRIMGSVLRGREAGLLRRIGLLRREPWRRLSGDHRD